MIDNNHIIDEYYNKISSEWGYTSPDTVSSGYDSVSQELAALSRAKWTAGDQNTRADMEQHAFDIYRSVNRLPISYFNLAGCIAEIQSLNSRSIAISDMVLPLSNSAGQHLSRFWFPNMQTAYTKGHKNIGLHDRFHNDVKLKRAINLCFKHRKSVLPYELRPALDLVNGNSIQNFKALNAKSVFEHICPVFRGNVLDFSSGYGGRMLGAMTSHLRYQYTGIEPNTQTHQGLVALGNLISQTVGTDFTMHNTVSEEFLPEPGYYHAAFSSPPYFNLEVYCDESTQCMHRYQNINNWFEQYVEPTMSMLHTALADDAICAVNISDYRVVDKTYQIVDPWVALSEKLNFQHVGTVKMPLRVRPGTGKSDNSLKYEGIYLFKKLI